MGAKFDAGIADLSGQLEDTRTEILEEVAKNEAAGMERDDALSAAIDTVAGNLDTTRQDLLDQLGTTEENLATDIANVSSDLEVVANYVGKPASEVTDADIDFVADIIAQQEVLSEPFVPTDAQLQYDVNNDGVIDINDQNMLEQSLAGQDVSLGGQFAATGLYAYNDQIAADQAIEDQRRFEEEQELAQEQAMQIQQQMDLNTKQGQIEDYARDYFAMEAARPDIATTKQMGLANIGKAYDFNSIFRDQQQDQFYNTPFGGYGSSPFGEAAPVVRAKGGVIENDTDRLIRLIGEG